MFELAPFALPEGYGEGILPLDQVKQHLAIEAGETEFDDLLEVLRDAAVDMTERYCGVYLAEREGVVWTADSVPCRLRLGVRPVNEITSAAYLDAANVGQSIAPETLRIGINGELLPVPGESWPTDVAAALTITFNAGYSAETRPPALVQAVRMFTAHLFENREAVATGSISGEVPLGFRKLCDAYRLPVL